MSVDSLLLIASKLGANICVMANNNVYIHKATTNNLFHTILHSSAIKLKDE